MKKTIYIILISLCSWTIAWGQEIIRIDDPDTWNYTALKPYIGKTVRFDVPFYVCNNYSTYSITISPRRIFQPTNQALPLSVEYNTLLSANAYGSISLSNVSGYHRMGERLHNLVVKVNSPNSLTLVSCDWRGNTREELEEGIDLDAINMRGEHNVLVCSMNLEYYLVQNLGGSMGAGSYSEHQKQRAKVSKALKKINADLYGFVEIEQGQSALAEIASDLSKNTGRNFTYINDGGSASGTYTKSGFVYCTDVLRPYGSLRENNTGIQERKKTQAFQEINTGEIFLFSVNHFKAKSGRGNGDNADQGDGQGSYNGDRKREAQSVLEYYSKDRAFYSDDDILIMGDLNAYAMEDPITILRDGGMIDLHRTFHADSSYTYNYRGYAGYLDHALCNPTLLPQVTGMVVYHINSDESDNYTYDKSNDQTMFRCSDHDPVLVGLRLDSTATLSPEVEEAKIAIHYESSYPCIHNAEGGYYIVYQLDGQVLIQSSIASNEEVIPGLTQGLYIINVYGHGKCLQTKILVH